MVKFQKITTVISVLCFSFLLAGCSPKYVVKNEYVPPVMTPQSNQCVTQCQTQQSKCNQNCQAQIQSCMNQAHFQAKNIEQEQYRQFDYDMNIYQQEKQKYMYAQQRFYEETRYLQHDLERADKNCVQRKDRYACDSAAKIRQDLKHISKRQPREPYPPSQPNYNDILYAQQQQCNNLGDCGCNNNYNSCYTQCGGKVNFHKICVENCD